jgi:hypothetical protein
MACILGENDATRHSRARFTIALDIFDRCHHRDAIRQCEWLSCLQHIIQLRQDCGWESVAMTLLLLFITAN